MWNNVFDGVDRARILNRITRFVNEPDKLNISEAQNLVVLMTFLDNQAET